MARWHDIPHRQYKPGDAVIREFICKKCGRDVMIVDKKDRRTVFCSASCERRFYRHPTGAGHNGNGLSGGMSLRTLMWREKMTLK